MSGGMSASVVPVAVSASRNRLSCNGRNRVSALSAASSTGPGACANARTSSVMAAMALPGGSLARMPSSATVAVCAASRSAAASGRGRAVPASSVVRSSPAASASNGSFAAWSSGT